MSYAATTTTRTRHPDRIACPVLRLLPRTRRRSPLMRRSSCPLFQATPELENASTVPPPQPDAMPDDGPAIGAEPAAVDAEPPAEPSRESILAAFARDRTPPQSAAAAARGTAASTTAPDRAGRVRDDRAGLGGAHLWVHCAERQLEHAPPWWRAWFRGLSGTAVSSEKVRPMSGTIRMVGRRIPPAGSCSTVGS